MTLFETLTEEPDMATAAAIEAPSTRSTDIALAVADNPALVLADPVKRDDLLSHIKSEIAAFEPDLSTVKGRDAIKSFAYKITRTKTAIDDAGKKLNEEARARINAVDAARREVREELVALAESVRRPLTEWEQAEKDRIETCRGVIEALKRDAVVTLDDTAETVRKRGAAVWNTPIDADQFQDMAEEAEAAKAATIDTLKVALARLEREEAERAELEKLRAEAAERERAEAEKRQAEEIERKRVQAEQAEKERREAAERAERERIATAERAAAEKAARDAREQAEREKQAEIDAANRRAEEAERAAQAERDRIAAEEAQREQAERVAAAEKARREADQEHRRAIKTAAKEAMIECGVIEEAAIKLVQAIVAGDIPSVRMEF